MKRSRRSRAPTFFRVVLALTLALGGTTAQAQLRVPNLGIQLPQRIGGLENDLLRDPQRLLDDTRLGELSRVRQELTGNLLRRHPRLVEADPRGAPVLRREILAWSPSQAALSAARAAGLRILRERRLDGLDEVIVTLGVPDDADTAAMLERLRSLDPDGTYDFNHLYQGSGGAGAASEGFGPAPAAKAPQGVSIGLVDSGVDAAHPVFAGTAIRRWGCGDVAHPSFHGSAVAALMAGRSAHFSGVLPKATLYAADIYCDNPAGGAAETIAGALNWLAVQHVPVINLSIVGPANRTLERAVAALLRRGHVVVAAVGNDGPAAPPLYPASYAGVVGVTAVDRRGKLLPEAARGAQVMFAAPGHDMVSASAGSPPYRRVRGTSFAAPIVAALLAERIARPDPAAARAAIASLAQLAGGTLNTDTGYGIVGMAHRTDPSTLR